MKYLALLFLFLASEVLMATEIEEQAQKFIDEQVSQVAPLYKQMALAYWSATGGKQECYQQYAELELQMRRLYMDKERFDIVKKLYQSTELKDELLRRQIEILYFSYLENQMPADLMEQMVKMSAALEEKFNTYRGTFEGQAVSDNVLVDILKAETNIERRKAAWETSKTVGQFVAEDLIKLVKVRNEIARQMGFANYYEMRLRFGEQSIEEVTAVFDELDQATREPFTQLKLMIDTKLRAKYGLATDATMYPYLYQDRFFQEVQDIGGVDMDVYFKDKDVKEIVEKFYNGIGLPVTDMLKRSDLYERPGKYQHAYCIDIDREGDVRTMMSLRNTRNWMETTMHELGHGVHSMYLDRKLPWLLREEAHTFTTEAIAQMMEGLATNIEWLHQATGIDMEVLKGWQTTLELEHKMGLLIFCRWSLVMFNFERELYRDPDQDLNKLWWDLVEKYQFVTRIPDRNQADWAAKIHFTSSPVYYHNYMLGNLLVAQMMNYITVEILHETNTQKVTFIGQPEVGKYLKEKIFGPGKTWRWDRMIKEATGEPLTAKYFAKSVQLK